jgi:hypothetical protein
MSPRKVMFFSALTIVVYDAMASLASMLLGFSYAKATIGSLFIYAAAGFFAERAKNRRFSFLVGALVGITDITAGWGISWILGPGRAPGGTITIYQWLGTAAFVVALASICAGIAGMVGSFGHHRKTSA